LEWNVLLNSWRSRWIRGNIHMINWSFSLVEKVFMFVVVV
jgi:hypothetical protein